MSDVTTLTPKMMELTYFLEEGSTTHSGILAWRIPRDRGAWQVIVHGVRKESDTTERLSLTQEG